VLTRQVVPALLTIAAEATVAGIPFPWGILYVSPTGGSGHVSFLAATLSWWACACSHAFATPVTPVCGAWLGEEEHPASATRAATPVVIFRIMSTTH
jgi:hypothetical protein